MTERLEEILNDLPSSIRHSGELESLKKYAREQAERVQELESELNKQIEIGYKFEGEAYDLAEENKRYREALEFYANEDNWVYGKVQHIVRGEKARKALEESE